MNLLLATLAIGPTLTGLGPADRAKIPPGAIDLFAAPGPWLEVAGAPDVVRASEVAVQGQPFARAIQAEVFAARERAYDAQVGTKSTAVPVSKGDVLFFAFSARSVAGRANWNVYVQKPAPPWTTAYSGGGQVGTQWKRFAMFFPAAQDYAAGELMLTLHISGRRQTVQFGPLVALNLGKAPTDGLPFTALDYDGRSPNAPWRKQAERMIDRNRKANLRVRVLDSKGRPVANVPVRVQLQRHAYEFGSFVEPPLVAQTEDGRKYRAWFLKAYNKVTVPMYWADWGWEWPEERSRYMAYADWFKARGYPIKAHCLIYPGWQFMPAKAVALQNDPPALRQAIMAHIREKLAATKPYGFVSWDILNELRDLKELKTVFGGERIYADIFKLAHELDPAPTFYINENTILTNCGDTEIQQAEYERQIRSLLAMGAPIEGIGLQGHFGEALTAPDRIWAIADRFAKFGLPLQITEFDLVSRDEQGQADYLRDLLTAWFAHPASTGFTMWGFWEGSMWQPPGALVAQDWRVKKNGQMWLDLVTKRWWTDVNIRTDSKGEATVRGFLGEYTVAAGKRSARTKLSKGGTLVVVR